MGKKAKKAATRIQAEFRALQKKKEEAVLANQLVKIYYKRSEAEDQRKRDLEDAIFQVWQRNGFPSFGDVGHDGSCHL
jgi:formylmethanofuran dehydrogenase subunit E